MANKKVCDRCGKDVGFKTIDLITYFGPDFLKVDLCEDCEKELDKWLRMECCKCNDAKDDELASLLRTAEEKNKVLSERNEKLLRENARLIRAITDDMLDNAEQIVVNVRYKAD